MTSYISSRTFSQPYPGTAYKPLNEVHELTFIRAPCDGHLKGWEHEQPHLREGFFFFSPDVGGEGKKGLTHCRMCRILSSEKVEKGLP